jgi:hypothetical protein
LAIEKQIKKYYKLNTNFKMKQVKLLLSLLIAATFLSSCIEEEDRKLPVTGVTVTPDSLNLRVGDTAILAAIVTPENADTTVTWSSSAAEIATVSETGKVTAISVGTAVITVTTQDGNKTATCEVTIRGSLPFTWVIINGVLIISGECPMPDYANSSEAPWYSLHSGIVSIVINEGIEHIGNTAFYSSNGVDYSSLTFISIPKFRYKYWRCRFFTL